MAEDKITCQAAVVLLEHALETAKPIVTSVARVSKNRAAKIGAATCLQQIEIALSAAKEAVPLKSEQ